MEQGPNESPYKPRVVLRTHFYRDNYQRLMIFSLGIILLIAILMVLIFWERTHKTPIEYYATTNSGVLEPLVPLDRPNITTTALLDWVTEAATASYNFNFNNYEKVLHDVRIYFTDAGYQHFIQALTAAGVLNDVRNKRLVVFAVATSTPVVLKEGSTPDGSYAWQVQIPLLITYQSAQEQRKQNLVWNILISREKTLESPKGIGISSVQIVSK